MKVLAAALVLLLLGLQYRAWFGDSGYFAAAALKEQLRIQERRAERHVQRNRRLKTEVMALRQGQTAVEARARADLGMIKEGEVFYVVTDGLR